MNINWEANWQVGEVTGLPHTLSPNSSTSLLLSLTQMIFVLNHPGSKNTNASISEERSRKIFRIVVEILPLKATLPRISKYGYGWNTKNIIYFITSTPKIHPPFESHFFKQKISYLMP